MVNSIQTVAGYTVSLHYPVYRNVQYPKCITIQNNNKKKLSTGQKVGIGLICGTGGAIILDYLFAKGKHVKSIINNFKTGKPVKPQTHPPAGESLNNSKKTDKDYFGDILELGLDIADAIT